MHVLNNWKVIHAKAPEDGRYVACIEGYVDGVNPRFPGASRVRTSYLTAYEIEGSALIVVTARGSEYRLGTPSPGEYLTADFLKSFLPNRSLVRAPAFDATPTQIVSYEADEKSDDRADKASPGVDAARQALEFLRNSGKGG